MTSSLVKHLTTPPGIFMVLLIIISIFANSTWQSVHINNSKELIIAEENRGITPLTESNKYPIYYRISNDQKKIGETPSKFFLKNDPPVLNSEIFMFPPWSRSTFT